MRCKTKKILFMAALFVVMFSFTGCINLGGSGVKKVEESRRNDHQGVFKSIDGGKTWEHKVKIKEQNAGDQNSSSGSNIVGKIELDSVKIGSMEMDHQDRNVLYLGTLGNGLYRTEDGAESWEKIIDEKKVLSDNAMIYDIEIEKGNSNIIYLATLNYRRGELLRSEDRGKTWQRSYLSSEEEKPVYHVEIDPISKNIVYIGTAQGGFLKSIDRGRKWVTMFWFNEEVKDFVIDFTNSNGIILRLSKGINKTKNGGKDWEDIGKKISDSFKMGMNYANVSSMTMDNNNPLVTYLTYQNLILVTKDGGYSWQKINTITPAKTAVGTIPQIKQIGLIGNIIYYGAGNVLYKSDDKGATWSSFDIPIKGDVRYTVSDYTDPNVIYVGSFYDPPKKK